MKHVAIGMVGKKFGRLTVVARAGTSGTKRALWDCMCECGNPFVVEGKSLRQNNTRSCGCLRSIWQIGNFDPKVTLRRENVLNGLPNFCLNHGDHLGWSLYNNQPRCIKCMNDHRAESRKENWMKTALSGFRSRAKRKGYEFDLDIQFLENLLHSQKCCCALTGEPFEDVRPSLDRKDSKLGYVKTNVQWVFLDVNKMKSDLSQEAFVARCRKVVAKFQ